HALRNVADDEAAEERQNVVRAKRLVRTPDDDQVLALFVCLSALLAKEGGELFDVGEVVAAGHGDQRLGPAARSIAETLIIEIDMEKPECFAQMELEFVGVDRGAGTDQESAIAENGIDLSLQNDFRGTGFHGRASVRERLGFGRTVARLSPPNE